MTASRPRILVLGLDGAGLDLVLRFAAEGRMPNLSALMARGARAPLLSTTPATTFPAWTGFLTGAAPSSHGVPDFTVREGYRVRFVGARDRRLPTVFRHLESRGLTCGAAWFPATYPPEPLAGYQISGWDSPVTARGDSSFVHPRGLFRELVAAFGRDALSFGAADEFGRDPGWREKAATALPRGVRRRAEMAAFLLAKRPVDMAAFHFGEADTAAHHFWPFHDPGSPRRPASFDARLSRVLADVYEALDDAVGLLVAAAGPGASVIVLSDHGSGGSSDVALHLNRMLEHAGLLTFRPARLRALTPERLRGAIPGLVDARLRRPLFRLAGGLLPSLAESHVRFGRIDFPRTVAFSEELGYAPSVWFNELGREPRGALSHRSRERAALAVEKAASGLSLDDGTRLVAEVIRRKDLHRGRYAHLFPDLTLALARPRGYTPACLPSLGESGPAVTRIVGPALLGAKGRSLPGCHTPEGLLVAVGPGVPANVRVQARIEDVADLVCALLGAPRAPWFEGRSPEGLPQSVPDPSNVAPHVVEDRR
ncbi:MAG: alkaline phosphatase family protein, partial [Deltaproteobacteria bacterium]|nr:alkaline phosphatase family protein [Deltaproteobacteria bacterium]